MKKVKTAKKTKRISVAEKMRVLQYESAKARKECHWLRGRVGELTYIINQLEADKIEYARQISLREQGFDQYYERPSLKVVK